VATKGRAGSPILLIPYMWIGDFVRCHSVIKVLRQRWPDRPVDVLSTTLCAPLADYMPGLRKAVIVDLPRRRLAYSQHRALADRLRAEHYGSALIMPRTWKAALAPYLAGIPERIAILRSLCFIAAIDSIAFVSKFTSTRWIWTRLAVTDASFSSSSN